MPANAAVLGAIPVTSVAKGGDNGGDSCGFGSNGPNAEEYTCHLHALYRESRGVFFVVPVLRS
jgi:hypothetical protein